MKSINYFILIVLCISLGALLVDCKVEEDEDVYDLKLGGWE
jgi:hypothetical protein